MMPSLKSQNRILKQFQFGHHRIHHLDNDLILIDSYHCSRYNIQTNRLSGEQFEAVFSEIGLLLNQ